VQFTDLSNNTAGWNWDFGDGIISTEQSPAHTYSAAGNYAVNLTAINANGTDSKRTTIKVLEQPAAVFPVANFSNNVTSGYAPLSVQFNDLSNNAAEWNWDFGDGAISTEQNPVHIYFAAGNYTVTLKVSNTSSQDAKTSQIYVDKNSDNLEAVNSSNNP
jgi:PKD repeat protein